MFIHKRLLNSNSRNSLRWRDSRNSQRGPCAGDTTLDSLKRGVHAENFESSAKSRLLRERIGARTHEFP